MTTNPLANLFYHLVAFAVTVSGTVLGGKDFKPVDGVAVALTVAKNSVTALSLYTSDSDGRYILKNAAADSGLGYAWLGLGTSSPVYSCESVKVKLDPQGVGSSDLYVTRVTGKAEFSVKEAARVVVNNASACALEFGEARPVVPVEISVNTKIALSKAGAISSLAIFGQVAEEAQRLAKTSEVPHTLSWITTLLQDSTLSKAPPEYRFLDAGAVLQKLSKLVEKQAQVEAKIALSFPGEEISANWSLDTALFENYLRGALPNRTPATSFRLRVGRKAREGIELSSGLTIGDRVRIDPLELNSWIEKDPIARAFVFRVGMAFLAKDKLVKELGLAAARSFEFKVEAT